MPPRADNHLTGSTPFQIYNRSLGLSGWMKVGLLILVMFAGWICLSGYDGTQPIYEEKGIFSWLKFSAERDGFHRFGLPGATFSAVLFNIFGAGAYVAIAYLATLPVFAALKQEAFFAPVRVFLGTLAAVATSTALTVGTSLHGPNTPAGPGGIVGAVLGKHAAGAIGESATLLVACMITLGIVAFFAVNIYQTIDNVSGEIQDEMEFERKEAIRERRRRQERTASGKRVVQPEPNDEPERAFKFVMRLKAREQPDATEIQNPES